MLRSYQQTKLKLNWNSVGHVAVVGLLHTQLVERVDKHNTVVGVVLRAVKAALEL